MLALRKSLKVEPIRLSSIGNCHGLFARGSLYVGEFIHVPFFAFFAPNTEAWYAVPDTGVMTRAMRTKDRLVLTIRDVMPARLVIIEGGWQQLEQHHHAYGQ